MNMMIGVIVEGGVIDENDDLFILLLLLLLICEVDDYFLVFHEVAGEDNSYYLEFEEVDR